VRDARGVLGELPELLSGWAAHDGAAGDATDFDFFAEMFVAHAGFVGVCFAVNEPAAEGDASGFIGGGENRFALRALIARCLVVATDTAEVAIGLAQVGDDLADGLRGQVPLIALSGGFKFGTTVRAELAIGLDARATGMAKACEVGDAGNFADALPELMGRWAAHRGIGLDSTGGQKFAENGDVAARAVGLVGQPEKPRAHGDLRGGHGKVIEHAAAVGAAGGLTGGDVLGQRIAGSAIRADFQGRISGQGVVRGGEKGTRRSVVDHK